MRTKSQHRQTLWQTENPDCQDIGINTDKPRDKLKTWTAKILGKRRIRSLQSVGGHNPPKKKRWLQYSQLRKVREKPEKVLYSGTFQSYRPIKEMCSNQGPGTAVVNVALTHLLFCTCASQLAEKGGFMLSGCRDSLFPLPRKRFTSHKTCRF